MVWIQPINQRSLLGLHSTGACKDRQCSAKLNIICLKLRVLRRRIQADTLTSPSYPFRHLC